MFYVAVPLYLAGTLVCFCSVFPGGDFFIVVVGVAGQGRPRV